jgi:nucleoside-diphosphate-sugar epimerase
MKIKINILGLGWYGEPLATELLKKGYEVYGTTRTEEKRNLLLSKGIKASTLSFPEKAEVKESQIVVLNIPPFEDELAWFKSWTWDPSAWIIFISSTSVYPRPESRSGELLKAQEDWVESSFQNWTILRFGGLIGGSRHPGKYLSGRHNLANRNWPVNLIHLDDTVGATIAVIEKNIKHKIIHVVSGEHPTRETYYTDYCRKHGLPVPQFDQNDLSEGKIVPNDELKKFYIPRRDL